MEESVPWGTVPRIACVVADNDPHSLDATVTLLESAGLEVLAATRSGTDVLAALQARPATVVVLDVRLPGLNGLELARRVAEIARSKTHVILYTGDTSPELVSEALDAGVGGVVVKGSPRTNLLEAIAEVAGGGVYIDSSLLDEVRAAS